MLKIFLVFIGSFLYGDFFYEYGKKVILTPVKESRSLSDKSIKLYKTQDDKIVKLKNEIVIKLKPSINPERFFSRYGVDGFNKISKNTYLIKLDNNTDILKLSQKLHLDKDSIYAIPNQVKKYKKR